MYVVICCYANKNWIELKKIEMNWKDKIWKFERQCGFELKVNMAHDHSDYAILVY